MATQAQARKTEDVQGGFDFSLSRRNEILASKGIPQPKTTSTGTTIAGIIFKDGVVLGADTRSTGGSTVADKNCEKIHYIAPNIYCGGAGTAADTENTTDLIAGQLELMRLSTGKESRVIAAETRLRRELFKYQGHVSAALVLGGVDVTGPSLFMIYPHGSSDKLPYATMGSGSLAAMTVFESGYKEDMDRDESVKLVSDAIHAGIFNDLGSGSNIDITVITSGNVEVLRNTQVFNKRTYTREAGYAFERGTTAIIDEQLTDFTQRKPAVEAETMDTSQ